MRAALPLILTAVAPEALRALDTVFVDVSEAMFSVVMDEGKVTVGTVAPLSVSVSVVTVAVVSAPAVWVKLVPVPANVTLLSAPELAVAAPKLLKLTDVIVPAVVVDAEFTSAIVTAPAVNEYKVATAATEAVPAVVAAGAPNVAPLEESVVVVYV